MATPPTDALKIVVEGQKWTWLFTYPNGHVDSELHVPVLPLLTRPAGKHWVLGSSRVGLFKPWLASTLVMVAVSG